MARTRPAGRLDEVADAALRVLLATGYRRTRMTDIADAAGVSSGLLYTYAASKEALFHLVLMRETGTALDELDLPLPAPEPAEIRALLRKGLRGASEIPALEAALTVDRPRDAPAELEAVVSQHYDAVHAHRRLIALVERCALDWPELATTFYERGRKPFVRRLGEYIRRRADAGYFRAVPDPDVAARFVIETVAWFANHRYGDRDGGRIPDELARATVVDLVTRAFTGGT